MSTYPMTEVIATREFDYSGPAGPAKVVAHLGKPAIMPDARNRDWYCPYVIEWPNERHEFYAGGMDALQALLLGISALRLYLEYVVGRTGKLTWLGDDDLGIDLVKGPAK